MTILELMDEINQEAIRLGLTLPNFQEPSDDDSYELLRKLKQLLRDVLRETVNEEKIIQAILRKFNDSGRRSPPWQQGNEDGHRRPQDGADGNRQNRWLFDDKHPYYATKSMGCLVEIKFILQTFSMDNIPNLPSNILQNSFNGIIDHDLTPGVFSDPLTGHVIDFNKFVADRKYLESGHINPHGRGGRHTYKNATLMLRDSNRQQADLTINECLENMAIILRNHKYSVKNPQ
jgi:hypothetical protein